MIIVDASVLIAHLEASDAHHDAAVKLLLNYADGPFGASSITLAEVFVGPARTGRLGSAQTALHALDIREISLGDDAAVRLAVLRAETHLKLPDCCVLLAAQDSSAHAIVTFDDRLQTQARRIGLATL